MRVNLLLIVCAFDEHSFRLDGVVEHSGSLSSGHYIAYVRILSMPKKPCSSAYDTDKGGDAATEDNLDGDENDKDDSNRNDIENDSDSRGAGNEGRWYYCSDSQVREVSVRDVLQATAYLLFFTRVSSLSR